MAHELTQRANGMYEMAYRGETPWHGHGQVIEEGDSLETIQEKGGMNYKVLRSKVRYPTERDGGGVIEMPEQHVLWRSDTKAALGIVSDGYKVVQPSEQVEFFRELVEMAGFKIETLGTLQGGKKAWVMATMGDAQNIIGSDLIRPYMMVATSFDGSTATTVSNVATRAVCANTIRIALSEKGNRSVKVSHKSVFNADEVKKKLGALPSEFTRFIHQSRELARMQISPSEAEAMTRTLLEEPLDQDDAKESHGLRTILNLFNGGQKGYDLPGVRNTAWGWLNAVTEYADHHARARSDENRIVSAQFGPGGDLKDTAHDMLLEML